ncbi:MAG: glycoside hydrolase family 15 protein [Bacillota bacterium]
MNAGDDASTGSLTLSGLQLLDPTIPERADAGIIGNGETAAIVGRHGAVTWWCVPRFDGYPVLAWALDPRRGGYLDVAPDPPAPFSARLAGARQAYYERSNVLVTRVETEAGAVALVDLFPWQQPGLVREVWLSRPMALALSLALTRASVGGAWHAVFGYPLALETRDAAIAVVLEPIASEALASQASWWDEEACRLRLSFRGSHPALEGSHAPDHTLLGGLWPAGRIAVAYGRGVAQARNAARALVRVSPATAVEADREWLQVGTLPPAVSPAHRALLERSLLALRALTFPKTGAVLAAATASWPATPSGDQNWDYRYVWLRDGSWTAQAFDRLGFHREARAFYRFALRMQGPDGHWAQPLFTVDGRVPYEMLAPELAGPNGERPIRFGNAAAHQLQLDNEGNVLAGIAGHGKLTGDAAFLWEAWPGVRKAAQWLEANWQREESGIWELREFTAHWLYGKAAVALGLRSAAAVARRLGEAPDAAIRWERLAQAVARQAFERAWSEGRGAWMRIYTDRGPAEQEPLDISVLAGVIWALVDPRSPRVRSTLQAMHQPPARGGLVVDGGVYRFANGHLPFYMAGFWMVRALRRAGLVDAAWKLFEALVRGANELGLMAEHHDPSTGKQWGNFPQAFSHEELIHALVELYEPAVIAAPFPAETRPPEEPVRQVSPG